MAEITELIYAALIGSKKSIIFKKVKDLCKEFPI